MGAPTCPRHTEALSALTRATACLLCHVTTGPLSSQSEQSQEFSWERVISRRQILRIPIPNKPPSHAAKKRRFSGWFNPKLPPGQANSFKLMWKLQAEFWD